VGGKIARRGALAWDAAASRHQESPVSGRAGRIGDVVPARNPAGWRSESRGKGGSFGFREEGIRRRIIRFQPAELSSSWSVAESSVLRAAAARQPAGGIAPGPVPLHAGRWATASPTGGVHSGSAPLTYWAAGAEGGGVGVAAATRASAVAWALG